MAFFSSLDSYIHRPFHQRRKVPSLSRQVNIGAGPPGSKGKWFRSTSNEPRFINTISFDSKEGSPTLVMIDTAAWGFFRNFDALSKHFNVIAIDQLGSGRSSRPDYTCKSIEESEAWCIDSFEEWRKAKNLSNFTLLGRAFGGYVAAKYALKYPEHVQHLILVEPAGFSSESAELLKKFRATWSGALLNHLWESNILIHTLHKITRCSGPWGPNLVRWMNDRLRDSPTGDAFTEEETRLLADYTYHNFAAKASGVLCFKHIFTPAPSARLPVVARSPPSQSASEWKVPTTFIYGVDDQMSNYKDAKKARKDMKVPCEIIRVPKSGDCASLGNASGFHSAVMYGCRKILSSDPDNVTLPEGLTSV